MLSLKQKVEAKENIQYIAFLSEYFLINKKIDDNFRNNFDNSWKRVKSSFNTKTFYNEYLGIEVEIKSNFNAFKIFKVAAKDWQYRTNREKNTIQFYYKEHILEYNIYDELKNILPDNIYDELNGNFSIVGDIDIDLLKSNEFNTI